MAMAKIVITGLTPGNCVQASTGGLLTTTSSPCGSGGGGIPTTPTGALVMINGSNGAASAVSDSGTAVTSTEPVYAGAQIGTPGWNIGSFTASGPSNIGAQSGSGTWAFLTTSSAGSPGFIFDASHDMTFATSTGNTGAGYNPLWVFGRTAGDFGMVSGSTLKWNSDTGFSRDSAGVVDVGNGTAGNASGAIKLANVTDSAITSTRIPKAGTGGLLSNSGITDQTTLITIGEPTIFSSTAPTLTSCTGGSVTGSANAFHVSGISSTTTCTATFPVSLGGFCTANAWGSGGTPYLVAPISSSASVVFGFAATVTDIQAVCF